MHREALLRRCCAINRGIKAKDVVHPGLLALRLARPSEQRSTGACSYYRHLPYLHRST